MFYIRIFTAKSNGRVQIYLHIVVMHFPKYPQMSLPVEWGLLPDNTKHIKGTKFYILLNYRFFRCSNGTQLAVAVNAQLITMTKRKVVGLSPASRGSFCKENNLEFLGHLHSCRTIHMQKWSILDYFFKSWVTFGFEKFTCEESKPLF